MASDSKIDNAWRDLRSAAENVRSFIHRSVVGPIDERLVFIHVPKCGGRSIRKGLDRLFRMVPGRSDGRIVHLHPGAAGRAAETLDETVWTMRRRMLAYHLAHPNVQCVAGHYQIDATLLEEFAENHTFMTVLRDPVKRWISHFFFNRYKEGDHYRIEKDLDEFLETDRAISYGELYVNYFTGKGDADAGIGRDPEIMGEAKENLAKFDMIGFLEDLDAFRSEFERRFGAELTLVHRNKNPAPKKRRREQLTPAIREKIRELCQPDIELYETARELSG